MKNVPYLAALAKRDSLSVIIMYPLKVAYLLLTRDG